MNKSEIVEMVAKLLSFAKDDKAVTAPAPAEPAKDKAPVPEKMTDVTTKDGIVLSTPNKFDIGVPVTIDGQPAPDATYELEDGSTITTVGGLVTEITAVNETPADEVNEEGMKAETFSKQLKERDEKFSALELKFNKVLEATIALSEAFNKLPVTDKIVVKATTPNSEEEFGRTPMTKKQKNLKEMRAVLQEIQDEQKNKNNK